MDNLKYNTNDAARSPSIITNTFTPERAAAIRLAAGDFAGRLSVLTYDPKDPEQRFTYASLVASLNAERAAEDNGLEGQPKTVEAVDRSVIANAELAGYELIAIVNRGSENLGTFWQRVDEITANPPTQTS